MTDPTLAPLTNRGLAPLANRGLAPYAADESKSRGRHYKEPEAPYRGAFQRDRDRIIHSTAFRRLVYKTQVFVNYEGDLYRTRMTHSLEVAQIARTVALALDLNETLTEAICLAHDLGHTPFGHAGQDALNACMRDYGGFEHNLQSLRVVDVLEEKYADFPGLNLSFETREAILKHCSTRNAHALGDVGLRFLQRKQPGLEAQIANIADAIAYNNHDVDDGLRAGLLGIDQLRAEPLFARQYDIVVERYPGLDNRRLIHEIVRRMINHAVTDLIETSRIAIAAANVKSIDDARNAGQPLVQFSSLVHEEHVAMKRFLHENLYRHEKVKRMTDQAQVMTTALFTVYFGDIAEMPSQFTDRAAGDDNVRARAVADYVAGMTDRFAIAEYERVTKGD